MVKKHLPCELLISLSHASVQMIEELLSARKRQVLAIKYHTHVKKTHTRGKS
jgi:hypothetical protein